MTDSDFGDGNNKLMALHTVIDGCRVCEQVAGPGYVKIVGLRRGESAPVVIIGQGPGKKESAHRLAFAGAAGTTLNKWLVRSGAEPNAPRASVYLTSLIKCGCPSDRKYWEMAARCERFLVQQIAIIRPRLVITLGKLAYEWIREDDTPYDGAICTAFVAGSNPLMSRFDFQFEILPWPHPSPANNAVLTRKDVKARMEGSFDVVRRVLSTERETP